MPAIRQVVNLNTVIAKASEKAGKAEASRTEASINDSQYKAALERVRQAEAQVKSNDLIKQQVEDKLSPPPTKQVQSDNKKGGMKTVVDEQEKDKLQAQLRATQVQIDQAQAAVESARAEAEEFKNKTLSSVGISQELQQEMTKIAKEVDDLKKLADDPQANVVGEEYQTRLQKAVDSVTDIAGRLPDAANPALQKFWQDIATNFTSINNKVTQVLTPPDATIQSANNYQGFFDDTQEGFDTVLDYLTTNNVDREVVTQIRNSKDSIVNHRTTYLGGMSDNDDKVLQKMLTHVNAMVAKINGGEDLTSQDLTKINNLSADAADTLSSGGENFTDVVKIPFQTIEVNLDALKNKIGENSQFSEFYDKIAAVYGNSSNSYDMLQGISKAEIDDLYNFSDLITNLKNKDGALSSDEINQVITSGTRIFNSLKDKYGFDDTRSGSSSGNSGNSRVGALG